MTKKASKSPSPSELSGDDASAATATAPAAAAAAPSSADPVAAAKLDLIAETRAALPAAKGKETPAPKKPGKEQALPAIDDMSETEEPYSADDDQGAAGEEASRQSAADDDARDDSAGRASDRKSGAIDEALLERAELMGLTRARAKKLGSADAIEEAIALLEEARAANQPSNERRDDSAEENDEEERQPGSQADQTPQGYKKFEWNRDDFNEGTNEILEKLVGHFEPVIEKLLTEKQELAERVERAEVTEQQRAVKRVTKLIDSAITEFPEELRDIYGTQPTEKLPKNSPILAERMKLRAVMGEIQRLRISTGLEPYDDTPEDMARLARKAAAELHEDLAESLAEKRVNKKIESERQERRGQTVLRPSGREHSQGLGRRERAIALLDRKLADAFGRKT